MGRRTAPVISRGVLARNRVGFPLPNRPADELLGGLGLEQKTIVGGGEPGSHPEGSRSLVTISLTVLHLVHAETRLGFGQPELFRDLHIHRFLSDNL